MGYVHYMYAYFKQAYLELGQTHTTFSSILTVFSLDEKCVSGFECCNNTRYVCNTPVPFASISRKHYFWSNALQRKHLPDALSEQPPKHVSQTSVVVVVCPWWQLSRFGRFIFGLWSIIRLIKHAQARSIYA